jgi:hypothetical protein
MTRAHAARMLLAHGPLAFRDFVTITGWPVANCRRVLSYLVDDLGEATRSVRLYTMNNGLPIMPITQNQQPERAVQPHMPAMLRPACRQDATGQDAGPGHAGGDSQTTRGAYAGAGAGCPVGGQS